MTQLQTYARRLAFLHIVFLLLCSPTFSQAPEYTHIVVFGDSLSDTGNDAHLSQGKYNIRIPGVIADYTDGRFTDGIDTTPFAINYQGVWIEQLAAMIPSRPKVRDSLDGGRDYAYGFASTGRGTGLFTFGPGDSLSTTVDNVGQQITDYLATNPKITDKTLFVVWAGAIDVLYATSPSDIVQAGITQAANVERLVAAGATNIIVPNLPPLGSTPRLNTTPYAGPVTEETVLYNDTLAAGLAIVHDSNQDKRLRIFQLDVFSLFNKIIAAPSAYALANVTSPSQGIYPLNPDTYLFWDDLHPTTRGHNILAVTAEELIERHQCMPDNAGSASFNKGTDAESDWKCVAADGDRDK